MRVLSGGQFAQLVEPTVTGQHLGVAGEGVLGEEAAPGNVLAEDPDRLICTAGALQHLGLKFLRAGVGVLPPVVAAGLPRAVSVRGDQLQYPLVTVMPFGHFHQDGQDPVSVVKVRNEHVDGLVDAPLLGEKFGEVAASDRRGRVGFVLTDQIQGLLRPSRPEQDACLRPQSGPPPDHGKGLHHVQRPLEFPRPAQLLHRSLSTEPLAPVRCRLDHQVQVTVLQQETHPSRGKSAVSPRLPLKIVHIHKGNRISTN